MEPLVDYVGFCLNRLLKRSIEKETLYEKDSHVCSGGFRACLLRVLGWRIRDNSA